MRRAIANGVCGVLLGLVAAAWAGGIDARTPDMVALKQAYGEGKARAAASRVEALEGVAKAAVAQAESMQASAKRSGNVRATAASRQALKMCQGWVQSIEETGDFDVPSNVRRELQVLVRDVSKKKAYVQSGYEQALAALDEEYFKRYLARASAQGREVAASDETHAQFMAFVGGPTAPDAAPAPVAASASSGGGESRDTDAAASPSAKPEPAAEEGAEVLAVSDEVGEAVEWVTLAVWEAKVHGIGTMEVPVMAREEPAETEGHDVVIDRPYTTSYRPVRVLAPEVGACAFRVRRVPGREPADVVDWPRKSNDWMLTVRVRPRGHVPARHAVELQVGFQGANGLPFVAGSEPAAPAEGEANAAKFAVLSVRTTPKGAHIYVDGVLHRREGKVPRTPCVIEIPGGIHDVTLRLPGYLDASFRNVSLNVGKAVTWRFERDPAFVVKDVNVSARTIWTRSGVSVVKGDRIAVTVKGKWSCGRNAELIDADGYPNDSRFYEYYLDPSAHPRQTPGANYGALLMKVGKSGGLIRVGKLLRVLSPSSGELLFDINEAAESRNRTDNKGTLDVHVEKAPGPK